MIVAFVALFVALGGSSYAALALPKNSVGPGQLRTKSVTSVKIRNGSLRRAPGPYGVFVPGLVGRVQGAGREGAVVEVNVGGGSGPVVSYGAWAVTSP